MKEIERSDTDEDVEEVFGRMGMKIASYYGPCDVVYENMTMFPNCPIKGLMALVKKHKLKRP